MADRTQRTSVIMGITAGVLVLASRGTASETPCWEPGVAIPTKALPDTKTAVTLAWTPLAEDDQCDDDIDGFGWYQVELGKGEPPDDPGDGEVVARLHERWADQYAHPVDTAGSTVYLSVFVCDTNGDCTAGGTESDYQLTRTTDL